MYVVHIFINKVQNIKHKRMLQNIHIDAFLTNSIDKKHIIYLMKYFQKRNY